MEVICPVCKYKKLKKREDDFKELKGIYAETLMADYPLGTGTWEIPIYSCPKCGILFRQIY